MIRMKNLMVLEAIAASGAKDTLILELWTLVFAFNKECWFQPSFSFLFRPLPH